MSATLRRWRPPPLVANPWLRLALYGGGALYLTLALGTLQVNWARVAEGLVRGWAFVSAFGHPDFATRWAEISEGMAESLTMTVVATYPAPGCPDCMDLLSDGKTILVTSRWARKLTFIDTVTQKVIRQVPMGRSPHGVWTLDHAPRQ